MAQIVCEDISICQSQDNRGYHRTCLRRLCRVATGWVEFEDILSKYLVGVEVPDHVDFVRIAEIVVFGDEGFVLTG